MPDKQLKIDHVSIDEYITDPHCTLDGKGLSVELLITDPEDIKKIKDGRIPGPPYSFANVNGAYTPNAHDVICKDCMGQLASDVTGQFWHTSPTPCTQRGIYRAHNIKFLPTIVFG
jgi:hypothetical protein